MTKAEFEISYARNKHTGIANLRDRGFVAVQCNCGDPDCSGWQGRFLGVDWEQGWPEPITAEWMEEKGYAIAPGKGLTT